MDFIVDGTEEVLAGRLTFGKMEVKNGGRLKVRPYDGSSGGELEIIASSIYVDSKSSINADFAGYRAFEGPGRGATGGPGNGAGYGGAGGGTAYTGPGGIAYGTGSGLDIEKGSGGGNANYFGSILPGGPGGGLIKLSADSIIIIGQISSDGQAGTRDWHHGSGGGSGGGIFIEGTDILLTNIVKANGGKGGDAANFMGGGGGGGGRIKVFAKGTLNITGATLQANGGSGGSGSPSGGGGSVGTVYTEIVCTPSWQCELEQTGYEIDGCGNRRENPACAYREASLYSCNWPQNLIVGQLYQLIITVNQGSKTENYKLIFTGDFVGESTPFTVNAGTGQQQFTVGNITFTTGGSKSVTATLVKV